MENGAEINSTCVAVPQAKTNELRIHVDLNLTTRSIEDGTTLRTTLCTGFQLFIAYFNIDVSRLVSPYRHKTAWLRIRLAALSCYCADHSQLSQFCLSLSEIACWLLYAVRPSFKNYAYFKQFLYNFYCQYLLSSETQTAVLQRNYSVVGPN
jgi:hypothetical protein